MAGRKRHACQCPPRPVFCPDRPSHSPQAAPQNPITQCPIGPSQPACRGIRPALGFFLCSGAAPYLFKKNAAFRRQGMRGVRPRAAGPFSDARKGTKSAFKGRRPLKNPAPPDKRSCSGLTCTLGCPQTMVGDVQRCCTLPFLRSVPRAAPGCPVSSGVVALFVQLRSTLPF